MACILLLEGDGDTRETLRGILVEEGFDVRVAPDEASALNELRANHVQALFVDLIEPREFLDRLAQRRELDAINVILLSADSRPSHPRAAAVLRMPFSMDELIAAARKYCA